MFAQREARRCRQGQGGSPDSALDVTVIVPREKVGQEAFAVIRDAMVDKKLVGLGRVVLATRERSILIEPMGNGLRGMTLRYQHEIRDAMDYLAETTGVDLPQEMLQIIQRPRLSEDRYRTVLVEKLREKQAERPPRRIASAPSPDNVVNLMDALERSLAAERPTAPILKPRQRGTTTSKRSASKRTTGRARKAS